MDWKGRVSLWLEMPVSGTALLSCQVFVKPEITEPFWWSTSITENKILSCTSHLFKNCLQKTKKFHQGFLCNRVVLCGNRVKVSSITSSGESIKPDLHKEGPGLDTWWALFGSHLIRGVGHSNSTLMPSGWLCPALLSFLSTHNGKPPSSNPNLLAPMTPPPQHTIGPVQPPLPSIPLHNAMGQIKGRSEYQLCSQVLFLQWGPRCDQYNATSSILQHQSDLAFANISKLSDHSWVTAIFLEWRIVCEIGLGPHRNCSDFWGRLLSASVVKKQTC